MRDLKDIRFVLLILTFFGYATWGSAQQVVQPPHRWQRITFPQLPPLADGITPVGVTVSPTDNNNSLRLVVSYRSPKVGPLEKLVEADNMKLRIHFPSGATQEAIPGDLNGKIALYHGGASHRTYLYDFRWGNNSMDEAWIEMKVTGRTYWFELPYGFARNPADPLAPPVPDRARPTTAPSMKAMGPEDRIVPWQYVEYDLGEIQNHWRLFVAVANPFDAHVKVTLYKDPPSVGGTFGWEMDAPKTRIEVVHGNRIFQGARPVDIHAHSDGLRRSDTFPLITRAGKDQGRDWGALRVSVDGQAYECTIPSSLFKYVHGAAEPYTRAKLERHYPELEN